MARRKILITGASGLIGGLVLRGLSDRYEFSGLSRRSVPGIAHTAASITDLDAIRPAFEGIDGVLHLGVSVDVENWDDQMDGHRARHAQCVPSGPGGGRHARSSR